MKKVIALCLALVLVLSVASLCLAGNFHCSRCGKNNAGIIDARVSYSYANEQNHNIIITYQLYCPDCHSCYWTSQVAGQEGHCRLTHQREVINQHLVYEYDVCGICKSRINTHTYYN